MLRKEPKVWIRRHTKEQKEKRVISLGFERHKKILDKFESSMKKQREMLSNFV